MIATDYRPAALIDILGLRALTVKLNSATMAGPGWKRVKKMELLH